VNGDSDIAKVTVLDLENKLVSYSGTYKQGVKAVFGQWNGIFVAENAGKVSQLRVRRLKLTDSYPAWTNILLLPSLKSCTGVVCIPLRSRLLDHLDWEKVGWQRYTADMAITYIPKGISTGQ
jgi:hypothetical protein